MVFSRTALILEMSKPVGRPSVFNTSQNMREPRAKEARLLTRSKEHQRELLVLSIDIRLRDDIPESKSQVLPEHLHHPGRALQASAGVA